MEIVGSSSTGFWLTRYPVLKELGWKIEDGVRGGDVAWGYRLWKHDRGWFVIDWSIHAKHWWLYNNVKGYFAHGCVDESNFKSEDFKLSGTIKEVKQ